MVEEVWVFLKLGSHWKVLNRGITSSECPSVDEWVKQLWDIYTIEFYSAIKKKKVLPFSTVWMELENIMLGEICLSEKDKYHVISLMCVI